MVWILATAFHFYIKHNCKYVFPFISSLSKDIKRRFHTLDLLGVQIQNYRLREPFLLLIPGVIHAAFASSEGKLFESWQHCQYNRFTISQSMFLPIFRFNKHWNAIANEKSNLISPNSECIPLLDQRFLKCSCITIPTNIRITIDSLQINHCSCWDQTWKILSFCQLNQVCHELQMQ